MANNSLRKIAAFDAQNCESAEIILANVDKHGGPNGGAATWARTFLARLERERRAEAGRGFEWRQS